MRKGARRVVVSLLLGLGIAGLHPLDAVASGLGDCSPKSWGKPACDCPPCPACGDPIDVGTGNVFEQVTDYQTTGPNKLAFIRYYNSLSLGQNTSLGRDWRSNYDRKLILTLPNYVSPTRPDGRVISFQSSSGSWIGDSDVDVQLTQSGTTWTLTDTDDTVETYTTISTNAALLTSIRARNGYTQTLQYDANNFLVSVTDSYGRMLSFSYQNGLLSTVTTPDGLVLSYSVSLIQSYYNMLTQVTYSTTSQTYLYENSTHPFLLTGIIDENGNRFATWTYDLKARATSSQHAGGADLTTVAYNDSDGSALMTNALGQQTLYQFATLQTVPKITEIDRLATATTAASTSTFAYDANGYKASETDWNGNLTTYVNDSRGRPTAITGAVGTPQQRVTTVSYLSNFHLPSQIVTPGLTTVFAYDANGNLLSRTETDTTTQTVPYSTNGQTRSWSYGWANFLPVSVTDPRGDTSQSGYDSSGALTSIINALGQVTQITQHTGGGFPQTYVDMNGIATNLAYDARQRLISSIVDTAAGPLTTTLSYDAAGNLIQVTLPDGSALANTYDAAHRIVATVDLFNQQIQYALDALADRTQTSILNSASTVVGQRSATFDALGRILQNIGGVGQTTSFTYDANGNRTSVSDPLGRVTHQAFDALNRRTQITDPASGVTAIAYDAHDRPVSVTDPNNNATQYVYDGFGDVIATISPDSGDTVFYYDAAGNLVQRIDAAGMITNYAYDALNRLTSRTYPGSPSDNVAFTYDEPAAGFGIGRLTTVVDNGGMTGALKLNYDERGNVVSETRTAGAVKLTTAYAYDAASRVAAVTYPSGWTAAYSRDQMGRVTAIGAQPPGPAPPRPGRLASSKSLPVRALPAASVPLASAPVASAITYLPFGPVSGLSYGNGIVETRAFDLDYRATGIADTGAAMMQQLSYSYDAANNVTAVADGVTPGNSQSFGYDALDRLTTAAGGYGTFGYAYDPVGNLLTRTANDGYQSATVNFSYAAGNNRLTALMQGGTAIRQFSYTASGNAASDLKLQAGAWVGNDLHYNQDGRLATVVTEPASGKASQSTSYAYDALGQRLLKQAPQGLRFYQYDLAGHLLEEGSLANGSAAPERDYIYLGNRPVAEMLPSTGALFFLHGDRLDTPQFATDTAQRAEWKAAYQPFGTIQPVILNLAQNLRLPGQYADQETGYYHNGFRDYDPSLGRYLESDPIGLRGGINTYAYTSNNPIAGSDRFGLADANLYNCKDPAGGTKESGLANQWNDPDFYTVAGHSHSDQYSANGGSSNPDNPYIKTDPHDANPLVPNPNFDPSQPVSPQNNPYKGVSPEELADMLVDEYGYKGDKPVKLGSCWSADYAGRVQKELRKKLDNPNIKACGSPVMTKMDPLELMKDRLLRQPFPGPQPVVGGYQ